MVWARIQEMFGSDDLTVDETLDLIDRRKDELERRVYVVETYLAGIRHDDEWQETGQP